MNRLIKAEWYRERKTANLFFWLGVLVFLITFILYTEYVDDFSGASNSMGVGSANAFIRYSSDMFSFLLGYGSLIIGGLYVKAYEQKVLHYEIMSGNKISHILLSKLCVCVPVATAIMTICYGALVAVAAYKDGIEDKKQLVLAMLVLVILFVRVVASSVLISTTFKGVFAMGIIFVRFMILSTLVGFVTALIDDDNVKISIFQWLTTGQISYLAGETISKTLVIKTAVSAIIEIVLWYVVSYRCHKKCRFN